MEERIIEEWYVSGNIDNVIPFPGNRFVDEEEHYCRKKRHLRRKLMIRYISLLRSMLELLGFGAALAYIMHQVFNWLMYM